MKFALATLAALSALTVGSAWAQEPLPSVSFIPAWMRAPSNGVPFVRLDKTVFASGESVFFWTGVDAVNHGAIPKEYWDTCRLRVTSPDGTQKVEHISWPIDGPVEFGWMGGSGLGEKPQPGRYQVVFEFAGQKTAPVSLVVEDLPVLKQITAAFVFGATVTLPDGSRDTPVTLTVRNNTNQTLRFPHRDGLNGLVSVSLSNGLSGIRGYRSDGFYPASKLLDQDEQKLPGRNPDKFTWADTRDLPTITLKPGEKYEQRLSMKAVLEENNRVALESKSWPIPAGQYQVTFSTMLQVLIGEEGGEFAAVCPVHLPIHGTAAYTVAP
jgi:hypothetical protein